MFKNIKDNNLEFISRDELEKTYKYQTRLFDSKIEEQQKKINELIDFISARFGEEFTKSNIGERIQEVENDLQSLKNIYNTSIQKNTSYIKNEIENHKKHVNEELDHLNDTQIKSYNKYYKILEEKGKQIEDIKNTLQAKDTKIANINNKLEEYLKTNLDYKKILEDEFDAVDKKISKINYNGITTKFEKKVNEQNKIIETKISKLEEVTNNKVAGLKKDFELGNKISSDKIATLSTKIQTNISKIDELDNKVTVTVLDTNKDIKNNEKKLNQLEEKINTNLSEITEKQKELLDRIEGNKENNNELSNDITKLYKSFQNTEECINNIKIKLSECEENLKKESKNQDIVLGELEENINSKIDKSNETIGKSSQEIVKLNEEIDKSNKVIDELNGVVQSNKDTISQLNKKIDTEFNEFKAYILDENKKLKDNINIETNNKLNKNIQEIKSTVASFKNVKANMEYSINNIQKQILELKNNTNNNNYEQTIKSDFYEFKKEYNQYTRKVDSVLNKVNKSILNIQEQSKENNKNLQVKIKSYIDSKNSSTINELNEIINKLSLSMAEKEKLQKIEMEEIFSKKLKEIQKENERILNKKIEEINNAMRKNFNYTKTNNVNIINREKNINNTRKNMYELIDSSKILKQTADTNKKFDEPKEKKSQILKFFYDDDDVNY